MKLKVLQEKYPKFTYENYSYEIFNNDLRISFSFRIDPGINFKPKLTIKNPSRLNLDKIDNLVFHLGLIEMLSYWKTTCSPIIDMEAGFLDDNQIKWWQDLIFEGMGQFFYENKIKFQKPKIICSGPNLNHQDFINKIEGQNEALASLSCSRFSLNNEKLQNRYLVPFTGGRDSIITLEKLKKQKKEIALFSVNTTPQIQKNIKISGIKKQITVKRYIDKKLLELNKDGYLNGHTPFTAFLSFLTVLCATLFDYKNIVFSNEKSSDEGNVKYLGKIINHQWAKSSEFEKKFKDYCRKYLVKDINYSSFLRRYAESEISKMLIGYPKYFSAFSSCNASMKIKSSATKERWCGNCPKCLFVYMTFYPFLEDKKLIKIFGKDIFENKNLLPVMKDLIDPKRIKPFECVGTKKEAKLAFDLSLKKAKKTGNIPFLLKKIRC